MLYSVKVLTYFFFLYNYYNAGTELMEQLSKTDSTTFSKTREQKEEMNINANNTGVCQVCILHLVCIKSGL